MVYIVTHAHEMDGKLVKIGRRLMGMPVMELLNFAFADLLVGLDSKQREHILSAMRGELGAHGGRIVNDPTLPESMQGMEMPDWWDPDDDPYESVITIE